MTDYWFTKSTERILKEHMGIPNPDKELVKIMDSLVEDHVAEAWQYVYGFTGDQIKFLFNNFPYLHFNKMALLEFFELTEGLPSRKAIAEDWIGGLLLEKAIEKHKTEAFDSSLLDFLDGQLNEKTINWGVGQVMKKYPKKFSPQEVKDAILTT